MSSGEALLVECIPNLWWGCCKEDDLLAFLAKVEAVYLDDAVAGSAQNIVWICRRMLAANEGQNHFGKVARLFLSFLMDFPDNNDFHNGNLVLCES